MNNRRVGTGKEEEAARFLAGCGLNVINRNYRNRFGEIDLIATDDGYIVFVEVKYRKTASSGHPEEAVDDQKARKISKIADYYRIQNKLSDEVPIRFDVVAIEGGQFRWYRNAFSYIR